MGKRIKIVLFDVDDTLIYTIDTAYQKTNITGKKIFKIELSKENFIKLYGNYNFEECVQQWYHSQEITKFIEEYNKIKIPYKYIANIEKIITSIKGNGMLVGIITNSPIEKTKRKLDDKIKLFDFIYADAKKPDKKCIDEIVKKYKINNDEIIFIGDSEKDYLLCKNANINFCAVNTGKKKWNNESVKYIESINEIKKDMLSCY